MQQLPESVLDQPARPTEPTSALARAWGDPAIVLTCGMTAPTALTPTSQLYTINDVTWLPEEIAGATRFTTVGRDVVVAVTLPDRYAPAASALVDVADAIARGSTPTTSSSSQASPPS